MFFGVLEKCEVISAEYLKKGKASVLRQINHNMSLLRCIGMLVFLITSHFVQGQVTIVVTKLPENTPAKDSLYIVGNFNEWNPDDKQYVLTRRRDGTFSITISKNVVDLEFKITRGSWASVEGDINGKKLENRKLAAQKGIAVEPVSYTHLTLPTKRIV